MNATLMPCYGAQLPGKCWSSVEVCPVPSVNAGRVWRPACTSAFGWQRRGPLSKLTSWTSIGQLVQLVQTLPLNKVKRAPNISLWSTQHLHTHHRHYTCRKTENRQLPPPLAMEGYSPRHAWHLSSVSCCSPGQCAFPHVPSQSTSSFWELLSHDGFVF